ncbi:MAG: hypothetical protein QNL62_08020 [Gammaproteobacteria bacterium]|nr:hypothetical protein [Gammaproteobacteria bacterium]
MKLITILVGILIALAFVAAILFVVFGQVTVRKLRKNPETKDALGIEFTSGWDIINVAQALAIPKILKKKLKNKPLSSLLADADLLCQHTNKVDKFLAVTFYGLFIFSGLSIALLGLLDVFGVFD